MKRIIMAVVLAIFICTMGKSQTTWDEYNYATKGYKDVLEKGLSAKAGYKVKDVLDRKVTWGNEYVTVWLKALYRTATNKIAAYIVVYQLTDKINNREYFCVPNPNSDDDITYAYLSSLTATIDIRGVHRLWAMLYAVSFGLKW